MNERTYPRLAVRCIFLLVLWEIWLPGATLADEPSVTLTATVTATRTPTASATLTPSPSPTPFGCVGDCDGTRNVTVNEVVLLADIALSDPSDISACPMGRLVTPVTVQQIIQTVNSALEGCGAAPPTPSPTVSSTQTPTRTLTPAAASSATPSTTPTRPSTGTPSPSATRTATSTITSTSTSAPSPTITATPSQTPTSTIRILDFGTVSGGGPGGSTFVPFELSADNITAITMDVCFVDTVFDPSSAECFANPPGIVNSAIVAGTCAPGPGFEGMTLHIEVGASGSQPLPTGAFMTCSFQVFLNASPGDYPVQLAATLIDTGAQMIGETASGTMRVFQELGGPCQGDGVCQVGFFCTDEVCCDSASCPTGQSCDVPGSEGTCAAP